MIDKSEKLSQLQKDLGVLAKLQKDYNTKVFKKLEEDVGRDKSDSKQDDTLELKDEN